MTRLYWVLVVLNVPALMIALFLSLPLLPSLGSQYWTTMQTVLLLWPAPQIMGYWLAVKAKRRGDAPTACFMLIIQLVVASGLTAMTMVGMATGFPQ